MAAQHKHAGKATTQNGDKDQDQDQDQEHGHSNGTGHGTRRHKDHVVAIVWQDTRTQPLIEALAAEVDPDTGEAYGTERLRSITGLPLAS